MSNLSNTILAPPGLYLVRPTNAHHLGHTKAHHLGHTESFPSRYLVQINSQIEENYLMFLFPKPMLHFDLEFLFFPSNLYTNSSNEFTSIAMSNYVHSDVQLKKDILSYLLLVQFITNIYLSIHY